MARLAHWLKLAMLLGAMALTIAPLQHASAEMELPGLENHKGDKCVDDEDYIRRHHPDLLKHHRDDVMRKGIRTTKYDLNKCVECHVNPKTGSVASSKEDFCVACHAYTGVQLNCWDCHNPKPGSFKPAKAEGTKTSPMMSSVQSEGQSQ